MSNDPAHHRACAILCRRPAGRIPKRWRTSGATRRRRFRTQKRAVTEADYARTAELDRRSSARPRPSAGPAAGTPSSSPSIASTVLPLTNEFEAQLRARSSRIGWPGHDLEIDTPQYVSLEIEMFVCVKPDYFRSDVEAALLEIFSSRTLADGGKGLFQPDFFTFGQTVYLSPLYAAAQAVAGVASVEITVFQRQGLPGDEWPDEWVPDHGSARDRAARERSEFCRARPFHP